MTTKVDNNVKSSLWPLLTACSGGLASILFMVLLSRMDKMEEKLDRLMKYELFLENSSKGISRNEIHYELPLFKHEDFITLKIEDDEIGII